LPPLKGTESRDEYLFKVLKKELAAALRKLCTTPKTVAKDTCVSTNYSESRLDMNTWGKSTTNERGKAGKKFLMLFPEQFS
jgi:hypothetical protein